MRDILGMRVYPRAPGVHRVRFRVAYGKNTKPGNFRDFSRANGGSFSPFFEFVIEGEVSSDAAR
jgi:hypothetical protein